MKQRLPEKILAILKREYPDSLPLLALVERLRPHHTRSGVQATLNQLVASGDIERPYYGNYRWKNSE